jgi:hypothetical protein
MTTSTFANNPICSVTSEAAPQDGQKHRSSGNFSTQDAPSGTKKLQWYVTESDAFDSVEFDVMEDRKLKHDPVVFSGLKNGAITEYKSDRQLYIANPANAGGKTFVVQVWPYPNT